MRAGMIDMESNTTLVQCYPAHEAVPDGQGPFPAVVVAHDRFGLNPHAKGIANRLAAAGFYALAPNFYAVTRGRVHPGGVGLLGFSMGGRLAFLAACRNPGEVRAAVCFYPRGIARAAPGQRGEPLPIDLA